MNEPKNIPWHHCIDMTLPCWEDYQDALLKLMAEPSVGSDLPAAATLQAALACSANNVQGKSVEFVSAASLPDGNYEEEIFNTGRVSTRANSWHDLCNALVWWRFPALKAAMNAMHYNEIQKQSGTERGKVRDALTLWDECGAIVVSSNDEMLNNLASRNWQGAFQHSAELWQSNTQVFICGHAMLEKFLNPYKSITAHALLIKLDSGYLKLNRAELQGRLDETLAAELLSGGLLNATADLSPLPLSGIPGWWKNGLQDAEFYNDTNVFRVPAQHVHPSPIVKLALNLEQIQSGTVTY